MDIDEFKKVSELVKKDERYEVYDLKMRKFTLSLTILNPQKETGGHEHENKEEVYFFMKGKGRIQIGKEIRHANAGDIYLIPPENFHKVYNDASEELVFYAIFSGTRE